MIDTSVDQINAKLSMMSDAALQKFAELHKQDPYLLPLAVSESNRRKQVRAAAQAKQQMPQVKVADASIAQMRPQPAPMPPEQMAAGIPQLAARNIEGMADGGIAGFAEGKRVFSADKYLEDPRVQRFLDYINVYEGSPKENQTVGYHRFDDLSKHPNRRVKFNKRGDKSTAAGAYQLINRTWQDQAKKQGLEDFSLINQKRAAIGVLKETGALDALMQGNIDKAKQRAARAWASIPGSTIGEATGQRARFNPRAEKILADISQPTTVAETKRPAPAPAPVRAAKRQETVGLSPELARQITSALPMASAQAGELPKAPPPAADTGISGLPKRTGFVDPLAAQRERLSKMELPSGEEVGAGATATADYLFNLFPFAAGEAGYAGARMFGVPEDTAKKVPEFFAPAMDPFSRFFKTKGSPEDQAAITRKIEQFVGENAHKGAEWISKNSEKYTSRPISVRDAENLINISALAVGAKGKGKGKAEPAPAAGVGEAKGRIAEAEAAAKTAAEKAQAAKEKTATPPQPPAEAPRQLALFPELETPKVEAPPAGRSVNLQQRFAEAQESAARAAEAAGNAEKAAALRASIPKTQTFTPDPAAQKFGVAAVLERKRAEQAAEARRAQDAAAAAERQAAQIKGVEEGRISAAEAVPRTTTPAARLVTDPRRAAAAAAAGSRPEMSEAEEAAPPVSDVYPDFRGSVADEMRRGPGATPFPTPVAEDEDEAAPVDEKKGFGLDNETKLMLGLGLLASPGGQPGGELSQLFSNLGRAGLGAVAAKREREKELGERSFKEIMGKYYTQLAKTQGRPEMKERMIARIMQEEGLSYAAAVKRLAELEYDPRYAAMLDVQREKNLANPMNMLQLGAGDTGGFTVVGKRPE